MSTATACQTPGAVFHTEIGPHAVACQVELPSRLGLTEAEAVMLEANLHNVIELVLAKYFQTPTEAS